MASRYGLEIRAATGADAEGLAELLTAVGTPLVPAAAALRLDAFRQSGHGGVLVALEWGPPSGVIAFSWAPTLSADMPVASIDLLAVAPDSRRRGIARTLLKAASQAARAAGCGSLSVAAPFGADETLRAFCAASGFGETGRSLSRSLRKRQQQEPEA